MVITTVITMAVIMDRIIDIHTHILPGVDDGAKIIDDSRKTIEYLSKEFNKNITIELCATDYSGRCSKNIDDLILYHLPHSPISTYHGNNFSKYLKKIRESKSLFLTNTKVLNEEIDPSMFDLVLVDDANLSESDVYTKVLSCNQVIFSGINNIRVGIYNDVLTKIKNNAIIGLKERFITTPKDLVSSMERARCDFYGDDNKNKGIVVSVEDYVNVILSLITQDMSIDETYRVKLNKDIKINCFVRELNRTRELFDSVASSLASLNISLEDIYYVLRKQLNITDLHDAYLWNADYNIIDLSDYNEDNDIYENKNLISNLVCVKKKLFIIDKANILASPEKGGFVNEIAKLVNPNDIIYPIVDKTVAKIASALTKRKVKVLGQYLNYDIVFNKDGINYGIILFNAPTNYGSDILNAYRDSYKSEFSFKVIYVNDFVEDFNGTIDKILEATKDDQTN